jgi:hypothetical protein
MLASPLVTLRLGWIADLVVAATNSPQFCAVAVVASLITKNKRTRRQTHPPHDEAVVGRTTASVSLIFIFVLVEVL